MGIGGIIPSNFSNIAKKWGIIKRDKIELLTLSIQNIIGSWIANIWKERCLNITLGKKYTQ